MQISAAPGVVKSVRQCELRQKGVYKDMDMETILEETVDTEDLKKFEQKYHLELNNGKVR